MYNGGMTYGIMISSIWDTIATNLSRWNAIAGIVLVAIALVLVFASTPIVMKTKLEGEKKGKWILGLKLAGMLLAVVGALAACL